MKSQRVNPERTWTFHELPTHPLAQTFRVSERMARRAFQAGRLHGTKPGLIVFFTDADITNWIDGSRSDSTQ